MKNYPPVNGRFSHIRTSQKASGGISRKPDGVLTAGILSAVLVAVLILGIASSYGAARSEDAKATTNSLTDIRANIGQLKLPVMIAGKPYSIAPGDSPGTYVVRWGNESVIWKTQPWMEPAYASLGPYYYFQWARPGLPFPWEVPVQERTKFSGADFLNRCTVCNLVYAYADNEWDYWLGRVYLPNGQLRSETHGLEFYTTPSLEHGKEFVSPAQLGKILRLYLWEQLSPEEIRGEGGVTTVFRDPNLEPQDTLYLPAVRKVRRLAGAVAKQYFPGTLYRYEDVSYTQALPELDYKVVGFELIKVPDTVRGYGPNDYPEVKRYGGIGEPGVVVEATPKPGLSWWYAKRLLHFGLFTLNMWHSEEYDSQGKQIRVMTRLLMSGSQMHMGTPSGPPAPDWWPLWGAGSVMELNSGFVQDGWILVGGFNAKVNPAIFTEATLYREPMTLGEWLH